MSRVHTERRDIVSSWILAWLHNHAKYFDEEKAAAGGKIRINSKNKNKNADCSRSIILFRLFCSGEEADRSTRKIELRQHQNGRARRRDSRKLPTAIFTLLSPVRPKSRSQNTQISKPKSGSQKPKSRSQNRPPTPTMFLNFKNIYYKNLSVSWE
jgi:hypothetical protein